MGLIYQVLDPAGLRARRQAVEGGASLEIWLDVYEPGTCWLTEEAWTRLAPPPPAAPAICRVLDGERIPVLFPGEPPDDPSLPEPDAVRARLLSRHGIAAFWIPPEEVTPQLADPSTGPQDPFFFLKRVGAAQSHLWRLFRSRYDARGFLSRRYPGDPRVDAWLARLPYEDFDALVRAASVTPPPPATA
ncbi:MAG TPA: hypothetical protein VNM66_09325 [Thermodesulfobacteriota bacterium]|nr:hypothetical protein [Thermodesulfobacteriota bacterium]